MPRYNFQGFALDTESFALLRSDEPVPIEPRVFDLLAYLIEHRTRTVTKDELIESVWSGAFVTDAAIKRAVQEARKVLDDDGDQQRCIRTVYGRGYRFAPEVEVEIESAGAPLAPRARGPLPGHRRWWIVSSIGIALVIALLGNRHEGAWTTDLHNPRIAVFPFRDLGLGPGQHFATGLALETLDRLTQVETLDVLAPESTFSAASGAEVRELAGDLDADYLLTGDLRYQRAEPSGPDSVRVTARLLRTRGDIQVWSKSYERSLTDLPALQTEIAHAVVHHLQGALVQREGLALEPPPTLVEEAYVAYSRALHLHRVGASPEARQLAVDMLERAIRLDPGFALAHAELGSTHLALFTMGADRTHERLKLAWKATRRSLELQSGLARAHMVLGLLYVEERDFDRAREQFQLAATIAPSDVGVLFYLGFLDRFQGRWSQALSNLERASRLDPLNGYRAYFAGQTHTLLRQYAEADSLYRRAIARLPDMPELYVLRAGNFLAWRGDQKAAEAVLDDMPDSGAAWSVFGRWSIFWLGRKYEQALASLEGTRDEILEVRVWTLPRDLLAARAHDALGNRQTARPLYEAARDRLEVAISERYRDTTVHSALGLAYAGLGEKDLAVEHGRLGAQLFEDATDTPLRRQDLAEIYAMVGEPEAAILELAALLDAPSFLSKPLLERDPRWDPLRGHPEFQKLLRG